MIVNELAQRAGIPAHVVRYYTRIGLLKPHRNPENGYKLFERDDIHRIQFIKRAQDLGFKLNEIEALLDRSYQGESVCRDVRKILTQRIEQLRSEIDWRQEQLNNMESELLRWREIPDGTPTAEVFCPLIESGHH